MMRLSQFRRALAPLAIVGSCAIASLAQEQRRARPPMSLCRAQPIFLKA